MAEPWLQPSSLKTFGSFFLEKAGERAQLVKPLLHTCGHGVQVPGLTDNAICGEG